MVYGENCRYIIYLNEGINYRTDWFTAREHTLEGWDLCRHTIMM